MMTEHEILKAVGAFKDRRIHGRRINVDLALALYDQHRNWEKVAKVMPGNFKAHSIINAVRRRDLGQMP